VSSNNRSDKVIKQFYHTLDSDIAETLNDEQKRAIEHAVKSMGLVARHSIDIRETVPWFGKRFYFVFLCGRDHRKQVRERSKLVHFVLTLLILIGVVSISLLAMLALYLIKSALGIDIFKGFSFGIWDWFKGLSL
jgi:ABC-type proline/glycine betaine transport system permease subunit